MSIEVNAAPIDKGRYYPVNFDGIGEARYYLVVRFKDPSVNVGTRTFIGQDFYVINVQSTEDTVIFESTHSRDVYLDKGVEVFTRWGEDTKDEIVDMGNHEKLVTAPGFEFIFSKDEVDSQTADDGLTHIEVYQTKKRNKANNSILSRSARNRRVQAAQAAASTINAVLNITAKTKKEATNRRLHILKLLGGSRRRTKKVKSNRYNY